MDKRVAVILVSLALVVGVGLGVLGHWYFAVKVPNNRAMEVAKQRQEEMNRMVRSGEVTAVKPDEIALKVEHSGDQSVEQGSVITAKTDSNTTIQEGNNLVSKPGQATDLTKYLKPGIHVDMLVNGDKTVAVHWIAQSQEQPRPIVQKQVQ